MILEDFMGMKNISFLERLGSNHGIKFSASRITPHEVSWINIGVFKKVIKNCSIDEAERFFLDNLCYAIPGGETFTKLIFDHSDKREFIAERYGGRGVGGNGGGVRCGTIGSYQIKGIGKNPLVGSAEDAWHSYGGLHASDAIYEAVYSYILEKIMPVGVANIYGVIITGKDAAYIGYEELEKGLQMRTWGALLVREAAARPAHYLRTPLYRPESGSGICDDHTRVRLVNRELLNHFGSASSYIQFLGKFLAGCANQFAFARMARIMHGSITPSNLCIDGRWLDLTNTTFVGSGSNIAVGALPFYEESVAVLPIVTELLYTFSKYNLIDLNPRALVDYYIEQFYGYLSLHVCYIFSWDYEQIPEEVKNNHLPLIAKATNDLIVKVGDTVGSWPNSLDENDSIRCLIKGLLIYEIDRNCGFTYLLENLDITQEKLSSTCAAYVAVVTSTHSPERQSWACFCTRAIRAMKRCLYSEFFFKGRLEQYLNEHVIDSESGLFKGLVKDLMFSADWIFNENREKVILFSNEIVEIVFSVSDARVVVFEGDESAFFGSFKEFKNELTTVYKYNLVCSGYDFRIPLLEIVETMSDVEEMREI